MFPDFSWLFAAGSWLMLVYFLAVLVVGGLGVLGCYWLIRLAVRHALRDAARDRPHMQTVTSTDRHGSRPSSSGRLASTPTPPERPDWRP